MGVTFQTPLSVFRQQHFHIEVAEERLVGYVVIAIAHIAVNHQTIHRTELELRLVLTAFIRPFATGTDGYTQCDHICQFGQP